MFESIDIKRVKNGFVVSVSDNDTGEFNEFVFSNPNQVIKFLKTQFKTSEE
jgi:hypothetical protein